MATSRYIKSEEKTDNRWLLPVVIALFAVFGVFFSIGGYSYGRFITIGIVLFAVLLDVNSLFCLIMFSFSFSSMLKLSESTITMMSVLYLILILKLILKKGMGLSASSILGFLVFTALQLFSVVFYGSSLTGIVAVLLTVIFVLFSADYFNSPEADAQQLLPKASLFFAAGITTDLVLCDIFPHLPSQVNAAEHAKHIAINRYTATVLDPNELSQIILIAVGLIIAIMPSIKTKWSKFLCVVMMVYIAIVGIRTNSKSYVLTLVALFAFMIILYIRHIYLTKGSHAAIMRTLPVLLLAALGCILLFIYVVIPVFESRSGEQTDFLTNRGNIWNRYLSALFQRLDVLLIGCGAGNVTSVVRLAGGSSTVVPHNTYLEYVIQFGLLGLTLVFVTWNKALVSIKEKLNTYFLLSLAAFLITAFGISVNANDCFFVLMALLSLPLPHDVNQRIIQSNNKTHSNPTLSA